MQVGSYTIDIVTKTVGRIFKASGVFPQQRNALEMVKDIKLCGGTVAFTVELHNPAYRLDRKKLIQAECEKAVRAVPGVHDPPVGAAFEDGGDLLALAEV